MLSLNDCPIAETNNPSPNLSSLSHLINGNGFLYRHNLGDLPTAQLDAVPSTPPGYVNGFGFMTLDNITLFSLRCLREFVGSSSCGNQRERGVLTPPAFGDQHVHR
ncbi:hypothetical protein AVEN_154394-1 [Araneus ventricosus]|uniref:Uncharacterized protein n=1 Tax=Araneus ventricosus TaxID=182803 RepID=A0A4Y2LAE8_ARAVE|nr:hypothetical protein AVEN_154394-1 [Araneus ventricosus]